MELPLAQDELKAPIKKLPHLQTSKKHPKIWTQASYLADDTKPSTSLFLLFDNK
jgi:hypothetical protein